MPVKPPKAHLLVVDDDQDIHDLIRSYFEPRGYSVECHSSPLEPLQRLQDSSALYDFVITDLRMPEMDGIEFVKRLKQIAPQLQILLTTAHGSIKTAVQAIQAGATDFLIKPINCAQLNVSVERGLKMNELVQENEILRKEVRSQWSFEGVIGKSAAIRKIFDLAKRVSRGTANVIITGESGTGKEIIARAIHFQGANGQNTPFVAINCSAIPENLLESELFGHAKGSFTGAIDKKVGLFEEAEGGVLFLDEIGDLNLSLQTKLLRVLQERKIKRIGENQYRPINVRIIAATHRNLKSEMEKGTFREDLYYRLCVIPIHIPPLRERKEDIPLLANHFLEKFRAQNGSPVKGFTKAAMERLIDLPWKGNVRELENVIERSVVLCDSECIDASDLPEGENDPTNTTDENALFSSLAKEAQLPTLQEFSQRYIEFVLKSVNGMKEKAAHILDIDRKTLNRRRKTQNPSSAIPESLAH